MHRLRLPRVAFGGGSVLNERPGSVRCEPQQASSEPLGVCGLAKRPHLDYPDLGFAFLPEHRGAGYAWEAARAVLGFAVASGLKRVAATTRPGNEASRRLLNRLGMTASGCFISPASGQPVLMYSLDLTTWAGAS
ncbi:MAG: hypothetical protein DI603_21965 [Roseateles depolymerans]|uniref:N-acetyltransferase domain-containing protein n=1 Tax=Roseateles depolymerans TaxID=76731 RepID=A0A2W5FCM8_9BURK|nr:MAG: hypothetical protein DI603_21965 [Roseateles depolymerans]